MNDLNEGELLKVIDSIDVIEVKELFYNEIKEGLTQKLKFLTLEKDDVVLFLREEKSGLYTTKLNSSFSVNPSVGTFATGELYFFFYFLFGKKLYRTILTKLQLKNHFIKC